MRKILVASIVFLSCCLLLSDSFVFGRGKDGGKIDLSRMSLADSVINSAISSGEIPGAVLCVVNGDKVVYLKAYGNKSVVPDTVAMTVGTVFDLASVSKCVGTTLSFMQLIDNGKVRLSDDVSKYIPGFKPWKDSSTGEVVDITVQDLMTHSSGLSPYVNVSEFVKRYGRGQPDSLMSFIAREVPRNFRPGTDFMYSCLNFVTLQHILENVTGEKLCDYALKNVFGPLGLKHTCYNPKGETLALCAPTEVQSDGRPLVGVVHDPLARIINGGNSGNAGVFSDALDLSKVAIALLNWGKVSPRSSDRILSEEAVRRMITIPSGNSFSVGRALGWDVLSEHCGVKGDLFSRELSICHTGYTGPSMVIDFETGTAVILLAHRVHPKDDGSVGALRAKVANVVAGSIVDAGEIGNNFLHGKK